jgi:hypothetical protein
MKGDTMEELTKEEKEFIVEVLSKTPMQGTLLTLPATLDKIMKIITKLQGPVDL